MAKAERATQFRAVRSGALGTEDLKFGFFLCVGLLAVMMVAMLLIDRWRDVQPTGFTDGHGEWKSLPATDASYWITMLMARTLGTAAGDWVAHEAGLAAGSAALVAT